MSRTLSRRARAGIGTLGVVILIVGFGVWALEAEYGSGLNYSISLDADGPVTVFEEGAGQVAQFESEEEAVAYTEQRRADNTSYLVPGLVIAVGAVLVWVAAFPSRRRNEEFATRT